MLVPVFAKRTSSAAGPTFNRTAYIAFLKPGDAVAARGAIGCLHKYDRQTGTTGRWGESSPDKQHYIIYRD